MKTPIKFVSFLTALLIFATVAVSAQDEPEKKMDVNVRGITLDSSYAEVQRRLGKPTRRKETPVSDSDECGLTGKEIELNYTGMKITLHKYQNSNTYKVTAMEITGSRWMRELRLTPGVTTATHIRARFGRPGSDERSSTTRELGYTIVDGEQGIAFVFNRAGKLTKVGMSTWLC